MKNKYILTAIIAFLSLICNAQNTRDQHRYWLVKAGYNLATVNSNFIKPRHGFAIGLERQVALSNKIALSYGALYSVQGYYNSYDSSMATDCNIDFRFVNFPCMASFYVTPNFALKTGAQLGLGFLDKEDNPNNEQDGELEFAIVPLGMACEFGRFQIDARYNIGVVYSNVYSHRVAQITVGYKFGRKSKK